MAVVTKFKVRKSGAFEAGEFREDRANVALGMNSVAHVNGLDERESQVKIMQDGTLKASEFREI